MHACAALRTDCIHEAAGLGGTRRAEMEQGWTGRDLQARKRLILVFTHLCTLCFVPKSMHSFAIKTKKPQKVKELNEIKVLPPSYSVVSIK